MLLFKTDFTDLAAVKRLAAKIGCGCVVTKWPGRANYNIAADRRKAENDERHGRCAIIR